MSSAGGRGGAARRPTTDAELGCGGECPRSTWAGNYGQKEGGSRIVQARKHSSQLAWHSLIGSVDLGGFGHAAQGWGRRGGGKFGCARGGVGAGGRIGDDHLALERVADGNGAALLPELGGKGANHCVQSVLGGVRMVESGDQRLEGGVDAPPTEGGALALGRQVEQAQGGEGIDLQRVVAQLAEGGGEDEAAAGQDLDQRGSQDGDAQMQQVPLQLPAAGARIVAAGAVVVEATAAAGAGQRGVDRQGRLWSSHGHESQDLVVASGAAEQFQAAVAEQRDTGLAVWQAGEIDAKAGTRRAGISEIVDHKDPRAVGRLGSFLDFLCLLGRWSAARGGVGVSESVGGHRGDR